VRTALDLLHFQPASLEVLTNGHRLLEDAPEAEATDLRSRLAAHGIGTVETEITGFDGIREKQFGVRFADGSARTYDKGFSGLGWWDQHGALPRSLGAAIDAEGFVRTDSDSRVLDAGGTPIPGLYCAGDLGTGWNQIPEAWAQAERAVIHAYAEYL